MAFFGADMNASASSSCCTDQQQTFFTFYCHRENRPYYYDPMSGATTWILPSDGLLSHLPGAPVDRPPPPPTVIFHRPQPPPQSQQSPQPVSPTSTAHSSSTSTTTADGESSPGTTKTTRRSSSSHGIYQMLIIVLCVSNFVSWGLLVGKPACWVEMQKTAGTPLKISNAAAKGWASIIRTATTSRCESLRKQGAAWWAAQTKATESFRNLGPAVHHESPRIESVHRHLSTESVEEILLFSSDETDNDNDEEPRETFMDDSSAEVRVDNFEPSHQIGSEPARFVDVTQDLVDEANDDNNERGGDRPEESASATASKELSAHEVIDENKVQHDGESNQVPVDAGEKETLVVVATNVAIDEASDQEATEEEPELTTEEAFETATLDETTTIELSDEIEVSEERLDIALDNEPSVVQGDMEALAQQSIVGVDVDAGTDFVVDQKIAGYNIEADDSLDQDKYVAEQGQSAPVDSEDYSDLSEAGDTSTGVDEHQLEDEPVFMNIDLRATPEEDVVDSFSIGSIHVSIEPTELGKRDDEPEPTPLQRILRMAAAAGVVIDPSLAKDGGGGGSYMANRPPLLTAMCPGPPEMRMLLSHCQAQV